MSVSVRKDLKSSPNAKNPTGHSWSILLLVLPILFLIWGFRGGFIWPINTPAFLGYSALILTISFGIMHHLSFRGTKRNKTFIPVTLFLFLLWVISGLMGLAKANMAFDTSESSLSYAKITKTHTSLTSKSGGRPTCTLWITPTIHGASTIHIRRDECDIIHVGIDGIQMHLKNGALGFRWMRDHSIVRDIDTYKKRLNIP